VQSEAGEGAVRRDGSSAGMTGVKGANTCVIRIRGLDNFIEIAVEEGGAEAPGVAKDAEGAESACDDIGFGEIGFTHSCEIHSILCSDDG